MTIRLPLGFGGAVAEIDTLDLVVANLSERAFSTFKMLPRSRQDRPGCADARVLG